MKTITVQYLIGATAYTKEYPIENFTPIIKQMNLSIPLITGAKINYAKTNEFRIMVGTEINLQKIREEKFKIEKYNIDIDTLANIALDGYSRACLLNYKKYDQIIVGINKNDIIVPDYYALKSIISSLIPKKLKKLN